MNWIRFLGAVWPDAIALVRALYERFHGDVGKTRAELLKIRDHGARLDQAEAEVDARIDAVAEREKG